MFKKFLYKTSFVAHFLHPTFHARMSNMKFTEADLDNLSRLARIDIAKDEKQKMLTDMQAILGYVSEINEVEGESSHGDETIFNVVREDVVTRETGSNTAAIMANAPASHDGYVQVIQVLK